MDKHVQVKQEFIELYSELHLNALLNKIADKICDYLECEESAIFLYDMNKEELFFMIATGKKQEELKKIVLKKGEGIAGWVAENQESLIVNDCSRDPRFTAVADKQTNFVTRSLLAVPVHQDGKFLGVLESINKSDDQFNQADLQLMETIASLISIPLQNAMLMEKELEKQRIEKELQIARTIQQSFLLNEKLSIKGVDTAYINIPSSAVGGDYYDIVRFNDHETIFSINDISGHGIPASLLMSTFRTNFIYRVKKDKNMLTTICHLNDLIAETTAANHFVTSFTCLFNSRDLSCQYLNAGHNPPLLVRDGEIQSLKKGSLVLGIFPGVAREIEEIKLCPGDLLLLYTDGVIEAENSAEIPFSLPRLKTLLVSCKHRHLDAEAIKDELVKELRHFTGGLSFEDDVTFIVINILEEGK